MYCLPNILGRSNQEEKVPHMGRGLLCAHLKERDHFEYLGVDVRVILKLILNRMGSGPDWSGTSGAVVTTSDTITYGELRTW